MEGKRKRKRAEEEEVGSGGRRRKERDAGTVEAPTEDEVEEFFVILRRMCAAVKHFEKGNGKGSGNFRKLTGRWRAAGAGGGVDEVKKTDGDAVNGVRKNNVLDLNAVPEGEGPSSSV